MIIQRKESEKAGLKALPESAGRLSLNDLVTRLPDQVVFIVQPNLPAVFRHECRFEFFGNRLGKIRAVDDQPELRIEVYGARIQEQIAAGSP